MERISSGCGRCEFSITQSGSQESRKRIKGCKSFRSCIETNGCSRGSLTEENGLTAERSQAVALSKYISEFFRSQFRVAL
jgi:hypothetical protein